ncbi:Replication factor-A carboxy-terminal domain protein [Arachis hypogaea]|nr:Replication factor-A carboxy-terminal domain protein [Arachis hypogaea]
MDQVLRTSIVPSFRNHDVANSMEVVLVDADSNKIHATVKKQLINRFKENIIEGQTYQMAYFSVVPNQGNYRIVEHEFKLVFLNRTSLVSVLDDAIPKTCFSFCPFDELLKMTNDYVYLVGRLTIPCVLFGEYMDEVHHFLGSGYMEQPVVVIQLAKVKFFRGQVGLQNIMHATRLFFNPNLAEVVDLKNRCTIEELHDNNEEGSFVIFGIVRSIVEEGPWWYSACVCGKSIQPQGGAYYCDFCQYYITNVTPRVSDDAAIIAMFELFNYDADDERIPVKDGSLGKISLSDHEYIVGKKDLCEVLGEDISSDWICLNVKTNCELFIDFLGEKDVEVLGLDDISSKIDIMKQKGKTETSFLNTIFLP